MNHTPELLAAPRTSRYEITGLLGRGATSVVYRAFDKHKYFEVALKSLRYAEIEDIYHFKQEFRFFHDLYHQNLVMLYDLVVTEVFCFYTMEIINGTDFVSFINYNKLALRSSLDQLIDGLTELHKVGRLHCDLKPSNILVEADGRTVLLDFGLSRDVRPTDSISSQAQLYAGTPAYMPPERLAGEPASPASDAYALGVILYQVLTGARPYPDLSPVAQYKAQQARPPPPDQCRPDIPKDLSDLAIELLSFDPGKRPPLSEVKRVTQGSSTRQPNFPHPTGPVQPNEWFVGREIELSRLETAFARTLKGRHVIVRVCGASGVGKTVLVERFLAGARDRAGALVLRSRCHHQESIRFNAIDGVIDALSHHLVIETEERLSQLAPEGLNALVTMFPVLGRVPFPFNEFSDDIVPSDPQAIVRQALGALRILLQRVGAGRPLILWIDDLQWSDAGSLLLLRDIAISQNDAPILWVFSYRLEDSKSDSRATVFDTGAIADPAAETEFILVQPLNSSAVAELVGVVLAEGPPADPAWVNEVAHQSAGLPFFVIELAAYRSQSAGRGEASGGETSAAVILSRRLHALSKPQRAVLELVSVAGAPIAEATLIGITRREAASGREIYQLLNQHVLRKTDVGGKSAIETFHDRIRVAVLDSLDPATRRFRHREIAEEMACAADLDLPGLVEHFLGADEPALAAKHAISAGRQARARLAFDQAAEFLLLASRLRFAGEADASLTVEIADALADAGRSAESAEHFFRAAQGSQSNPQAAAHYQARAAQQFLFSGQLTQGYTIYRQLFTDLGLAFPTTIGAAFRMSITNRILFSMGFRRLTVRSKSGEAVQDLTRADTLWAASMGFLMMDYPVGDAIFSHYMREAGALGERSRVLRALALEAAILANVSQHWIVRRSESLIQRAEDLARGSADPYDHVVVQTCRSGVAFVRGRWWEASEFAREAVALHRRDCVRYNFEVPIALAFRVSALTLGGALTQAKGETREAIDDAQRRGDMYVSRLFKSGYTVYIALAEDSPDTAIADAAILLNDVPSDHFTSLHWSHFIATVNALVYAQRAWDAWSLVQDQWTSIQTSGFLKLGCIGAHIREIRARAALSAARAGQPPKGLEGWTFRRLLRLAEEDARRIAQTDVISHAAPTAAAIRSGIVALNGDAKNRRALLESALQGFEQAGMSLHRAAAELQLASLAPDWVDSGAAGLRTMSNEGVRRPDHMSAFLMFV